MHTRTFCFCIHSRKCGRALSFPNSVSQSKRRGFERVRKREREKERERLRKRERVRERDRGRKRES